MSIKSKLKSSPSRTSSLLPEVAAASSDPENVGDVRDPYTVAPQADDYNGEEYEGALLLEGVEDPDDITVTKPTLVSTLTLNLDGLTSLSRDELGNISVPPEALADWYLSDSAPVTITGTAYYPADSDPVIPDDHNVIMRMTVNDIVLIGVCPKDTQTLLVDIDYLNDFCKEAYLVMSEDNYESELVDLDAYTRKQLAEGAFPLAATAPMAYRNMVSDFTDNTIVMGSVLAELGNTLEELPKDVLEANTRYSPKITVDWDFGVSYFLDMRDDVKKAHSDILYLPKLMEYRSNVLEANPA